MRQQAMENLLIQFEEAVNKLSSVWDAGFNSNDNIYKLDEAIYALENLSTKSSTLRDRTDKSASVIKELVNK